MFSWFRQVEIGLSFPVLMFTWLEERTLEWIIFVFLMILIFACGIWRLSFGARDKRMSRKD